MTCHHFNLLIIFMWELLYCLTGVSSAISGKVCQLQDLQGCREDETCEQVDDLTGICKCRKEFQKTEPGGPCILLPDHPELPDPEGVIYSGASAATIAIGLLVPLLVIAIAGFVFAAKKYRWLQRFREQALQLRVRNYDTVLVNQEDDPPLA